MTDSFVRTVSPPYTPLTSLSTRVRVLRTHGAVLAGRVDPVCYQLMDKIVDASSYVAPSTLDSGLHTTTTQLDMSYRYMNVTWDIPRSFSEFTATVSASFIKAKSMQ